MKRIQHLAGQLRMVMIFGYMLLGLAVILVVTLSDADIGFEPSDLASPFAFLAALGGLVRLGAFVYGNVAVFRLLSLYEGGTLFAADNVRWIRAVGSATLVYGLTPLLTVNGGNVDIGWDIGVLVSGAFVSLIGWVMDEGRKLQEEQSLVV